MGTSFDQHHIDAALGDLDDAGEVLEPSWVAALRLVDELTGDMPSVDARFHAELREHFGEDQILELGSALAVASGWQRFIEAFGIRPDHWSPGDELPPRPGS